MVKHAIPRKPHWFHSHDSAEHLLFIHITILSILLCAKNIQFLFRKKRSCKATVVVNVELERNQKRGGVPFE